MPIDSDLSVDDQSPTFTMAAVVTCHTHQEMRVVIEPHADGMLRFDLAVGDEDGEEQFVTFELTAGEWAKLEAAVKGLRR